MLVTPVQVIAEANPPNPCTQTSHSQYQHSCILSFALCTLSYPEPSANVTPYSVHPYIFRSYSVNPHDPCFSYFVVMIPDIPTPQIPAFPLCHFGHSSHSCILQQSPSLLVRSVSIYIPMYCSLSSSVRISIICLNLV